MNEPETTPTTDSGRLPAAHGSPPNVLWLQWYGDGSPDDVGEVSDRDVTWARDSIFSADLRYISAQWMKEQAAWYRKQAKAVSGDLKDPYRQMAWAFELVLELAAEGNTRISDPHEE